VKVRGSAARSARRWAIVPAGAVVLLGAADEPRGDLRVLCEDRFFGVVTAYVSGPLAARYEFTSSLPVQVLKVLEPAPRPLVMLRETSAMARQAG
jgi:hypothetical protein